MSCQQTHPHARPPQVGGPGARPGAHTMGTVSLASTTEQTQVGRGSGASRHHALTLHTRRLHCPLPGKAL